MRKSYLTAPGDFISYTSPPPPPPYNYMAHLPSDCWLQRPGDHRRSDRHQQPLWLRGVLLLPLPAHHLPHHRHHPDCWPGGFPLLTLPQPICNIGTCISHALPSGHIASSPGPWYTEQQWAVMAQSLAADKARRIRAPV